jgi:DNA-binding HxlR family transcriptional regulator
MGDLFLRGNSSVHGYGQYCPLAKGAEVFAERWTPLILRELLRGSTSFNEIHRGVPRMSRTLLGGRLRKLEACGVLEPRDGKHGHEYHLTSAGRELGPVVVQLGTWAQRWFRSKFVTNELDAGVLMWDMRCTLDPNGLPDTRTCAQFVFIDVPQSTRNWWLINDEGELDLCPVDPGVEVRLVVRTTLDAMTRVWMGDVPLSSAIQSGRLKILGPPKLRHQFERWLCLSPYACVPEARRADMTDRRRER